MHAQEDGVREAEQMPSCKRMLQPYAPWRRFFGPTAMPSINPQLLPFSG